jgi:ketosteroid isomerase-like protein
MTFSTEQILDRHLAAFGSGSVGGLLEDYAPEATMITPDGAVKKGPAEIRPVFEVMLAEFAKPGMSFSLTGRTVDGETAWITWTAETADNVYEFGTDTFVIRDGKIQAQTFAVKARAK